MSAIPYSQFIANFKFLSPIMRRPGLLLALWKDSSKNQVCLVAEYSNLDKPKRDEIFAEFLKTYTPAYCLRLLHYTGKKSPHERNLVLVFEHCQTLRDFLIDPRANIVKSLAIREIVYLFRQVVAALNHFHVADYFHGDVREENLYVDEQNRVKVLRLPHFPSNVMLVREKRAAAEHQEANAVMLPPELETVAAADSDLAQIPKSQMQQNDIFCLGLLCARLLNPVLFLKAVSAQPGKADVGSLITLVDSLEPHLGIEFSSALRNCLALNPEERTLSKSPTKSQADISASSLFEWDKQVEIAEGQSIEDSQGSQHLVSGLGGTNSSKEEIKEDDSYADQSSLEGFLGHQRDSRLSSLGFESGNKDIGLGFKNNKAPITPLGQAELKPRTSQKPKGKTHHKNDGIPDDLSKSPNGKKRPLQKAYKKLDASSVNHLKVKCIQHLEKIYFSPLSSESTLNKTLGKTYYNLKIVPDPDLPQQGIKIQSSNRTRTLGFIHYPSGDLYFGFVRELCREDVGIHFYSNGEVFHGEFRKNIVNGRGAHLYLNGDVLVGQYRNERLDGSALLMLRDDGKLLDCKFEAGELVDKAEVDTELDLPDLADFLAEGYLQSTVVDTIRSLYLTSQKANLSSSQVHSSSNRDEQAKAFVKKSSATKDSPLKEGLLLTKDELARFNHAENRQREFFNGYYYDLMADARAKSSKKGGKAGANSKDSDTDEGNDRVRRFYAALKTHSPANFLSDEESENSQRQKPIGKTKPDQGTGHRRQQGTEHQEKLELSSGYRWPHHYVESRVVSSHSPHKEVRTSRVSKFELPLKSVRFTREEIAEVGEAAEESSNQVLLNQIDEERNRLKNVLDKIDSAEENPMYERKTSSFRHKDEAAGRTNDYRIDVLKRVVIRSADRRPEEIQGLIEGEQPPDLLGSEDQESGFQQVVFGTGDRFYGEFEAGRAHGPGIYYWAAGGSARGSWHRGRLATLVNWTNS